MEFLNYDFTSVPTIKQFIQDKRQIKLLMGPVGSGKSSGCVIHLLLSAIAQKPDKNGVRPTRFAIIRNTLKMLHDTTKKTIENWLPKHLYQWKEAKSMFILDFMLEDDTRVYSEWLLRALDDENQIRDLLSLELTGAWINEAKEINQSVFNMLRSRIGRYPPKKQVEPTYTFIIMDTNPPSTQHWLYKLFVEEYEKLKDKFAFYKQPSGLSPLAENLPNLPKNYYQDLAVGQDEDFIKVYIHGEWGEVKSGKAVYSAYSDSFHCSKDILEPFIDKELIIGMDFGLYPACAFIQYAGGKIYVIDELVSTEATDIETFINERLLPHLMDNYPHFKTIIIGDQSGVARSQIDGRTVFHVLRSYGLDARPSYTNSLHDRLKAVNYFLTRRIGEEPAFILSPRCEYLRKGFISEYKFRKLKVGFDKYSETPEKNLFSHVHDALQYACLYVYPRAKDFYQYNQFSTSQKTEYKLSSCII